MQEDCMVWIRARKGICEKSNARILNVNTEMKAGVPNQILVGALAFVFAKRLSLCKDERFCKLHQSRPRAEIKSVFPQSFFSFIFSKPEKVI